MNLSSELITPVLDAHAALAREEHRRWVISFKPRETAWGMSDMSDMVSMLQGMGYKEDVHEEELRVLQEEDMSLLVVRGIHNISNYCQHENPSTSQGTWYRYTRIEAEGGASLPDIFSLLVVSGVVEEAPLGSAAEPPNWGASMKAYTITKRIVYTSLDTGVRYIVGMVKSVAAPAPTMIKSGVSGAKPSIVCYIEVPASMSSKEVMVSVVRMLQVIEQNRSPITVEQQKQILQSYDALVDKVRDKRHAWESYYLAPKPYTLEQVHVSDPGTTYGQLTILDGYAVTDKADGERMLMFVDDTGSAYLINSAFEVRGTGIKAKRDTLHNTLLDGEFLTTGKRLDGVKRDLFAVFDVYFVGGKSVMDLPLVSTEGAKSKRGRVDTIASVLEPSMWEQDKETSVQVIAKEHVVAEGMGMFKACRDILDRATRRGAPYDIDGLVFTPTDLPVFGYYPGKPVVIRGAGSTWDRVLKWKPPEQNSIDFCVSLDKNPVVDMRFKGKHARLLLSCGYSAMRNEEISVSRGLRLLQTHARERDLGDEYILKAFTPQYRYENGIQYAHIPYGPDGVVRAENGDEVQDGSVVEFWYDIHDKRPVSYRWRALRVRNDKMRNSVSATDLPAKRMRGRIRTSKANDWKTATSIWKSIHEPVSKEMITGVVRAPQLVQQAVDLKARLLGTDAIYYGRNVAREHLLSVEMLNFHNTVVKDNLYKWQLFPKNNLLELACGMAGDLGRWQDPVTGFSFHNILGVDLVRDNITKPMDGAYARVLRPRYGVPRKRQNYVFVIGDCSKPLQTGAAAKGLDKDSEDVLLELYGKRTTRRILTTIYPFAKEGFDMVSCQFAIHYFFETEEKLKGFLTNVRDNLRPGGLFITTFMDGASVERLIREKGTNGLVEGRKLDGSVVVWAIRRIDQEASVSATEPLPMEGGGMKTEKLKIQETGTDTVQSVRLINVPAKGNCMFIALEIAAYGEERSETRDGSWMRSSIMERMREILSRGDDVAMELYEFLRLYIDDMPSDLVSRAVKEVGRPLYSSGDENASYLDKAAGYIEWMSRDGVWGSDVELRVAMELLERPIRVYQTDKDTGVASAYSMAEDESKFQDARPVRLWYNGENHYKAILENEAPVPAVPPVAAIAPASAPVPVPVPVPTGNALFGRLIDVYLENTNRLIPEYLVDFNLLQEYAARYGLELVHDGMFSDTYRAFKEKNPRTNDFAGFDKDPVQQEFSFLNRWAVFRRKA